MHVKMMRTAHLGSPSNPVLGVLIWIFHLICYLMSQVTIKSDIYKVAKLHSKLFFILKQTKKLKF